MAVLLTAKMTSNTAPSGVVTCSPAATDAQFQAFNQDGATSYFRVVGNVYPIWVAYQFVTPVTVTQYQFLTHSAYLPSAWKLQGSADGTTWVDLDSRTGQTPAGNPTWNTYTPTVIGGGNYVRLYVSAGSTNGQLFYEIYFNGDNMAPPANYLYYPRRNRLDTYGVSQPRVIPLP